MMNDGDTTMAPATEDMAAEETVETTEETTEEVAAPTEETSA